MNKKVIAWTCLLVNCVIVVTCGKILGVYPAPSFSHQVVFRRLTQELLKHGHEVTVLTPDPEYPKGGTPKNLTEIDVHDVSYNLQKKLIRSHLVTDTNLGFSDEISTAKFTSAIFEAQLNVPEVKDLLFSKKHHFDLILIEAVYLRPAIAVSYVFKAPVIVFSSTGSVFWLNHIFGIVDHPILYPTVLHQKVYNLTTFEKIGVYFKYIQSLYDRRLLEKSENLMLQKHFGPDIPPISNLFENVDMLFLNMHPIWMDNQPTPPSVVFVGGIHQTEAKLLPKDLKTYLDSSERGVIYLSFGTNALASMIPKDKIEIIAEVLSKLPYNILWKWDQDELPVKAENIKLSKWFPQADLLKHPNIKLFINQGGLQSTDEAITAGVPSVVIPMLGDQWFNAEKYVFHGIGKKILIENLSREVFKSAVETVINDNSYRENVLRLRNLMQDQQEKSAERAVWWIEYILRHGSGKHLRAAAANLPLSQYYEIDILIVVLFIFVSTCVILIALSFFSCKFLCSYVTVRNKNKEKQV